MPKKEKNLNIPNTISVARILLCFVFVYLAFAGAGIWTLVIIFSIAAITDALDGFIARRFDMKTELGRKLDMFADRALMISAIIAILGYMKINDKLTSSIVIQMVLIILREVIALPFLMIGLILKKDIFPQARKIAKFTTVLQGITFPMIILGWGIAWIFAVLTAVTGILSGLKYGDDVFSKKPEYASKHRR
jgi:cardiolipin synthase